MQVVIKEPVTISVSETGPKLVTKMLVLISVTFSVNTDTAQTKKIQVHLKNIYIPLYFLLTYVSNFECAFIFFVLLKLSGLHCKVSFAI